MVHSYQWWWICDVVCPLLPHIVQLVVSSKKLQEPSIGDVRTYPLEGFPCGIHT